MNRETTRIRDYQRVEQALNFVARNYRNQPSLAEIAQSVHLSDYHFQRLFQRWVGVTPKQFLRYLTVSHAQECLQSGYSTMEAAYEVGLSAPARLGELFVRLEAITPGEYRSGGVGIDVRYGVHETPFGRCMLGVTKRGVCGLHFIDEQSTVDSAFSELQQRLPHAAYLRSDEETRQLAVEIFSGELKTELSLICSGTSFQLKVWEALLRIPEGGVRSYSQIASAIGNPSAVRAVGTAISQNPVALLIPCHRVIRSDGLPGGYRWGLGRKLAIQGWEVVTKSR